MSSSEESGCEVSLNAGKEVERNHEHKHKKKKHHHHHHHHKHHHRHKHKHSASSKEKRHKHKHKHKKYNSSKSDELPSTNDKTDSKNIENVGEYDTKERKKLEKDKGKKPIEDMTVKNDNSDYSIVPQQMKNEDSNKKRTSSNTDNMGSEHSVNRAKNVPIIETTLASIVSSYNDIDDDEEEEEDSAPLPDADTQSDDMDIPLLTEIEEDMNLEELMKQKALLQARLGVYADSDEEEEEEEEEQEQQNVPPPLPPPPPLEVNRPPSQDVPETEVIEIQSDPDVCIIEDRLEKKHERKKRRRSRSRDRERDKRHKNYHQSLERKSPAEENSRLGRERIHEEKDDKENRKPKRPSSSELEDRSHRKVDSRDFRRSRDRGLDRMGHSSEREPHTESSRSNLSLERRHRPDEVKLLSEEISSTFSTRSTGPV